MGRKRKIEGENGLLGQEVESIANDLAAENSPSGEPKPEDGKSQTAVPNKSLFDFAEREPGIEQAQTAVTDWHQNEPEQTAIATPTTEAKTAPPSEPGETLQQKLARLEKTLTLRCKQEILLKSLLKNVASRKKECEKDILETMEKILNEKQMPLLQNMLAEACNDPQEQAVGG